MVHKCCVSKCRGNYDKSTKVSVFKFPDDENLRKKWIHAMKRKNFTPTKNHRVCELHFRPQDIRRSRTFVSDDGQEITLPLQVPPLVWGAVPKLLPNWPEYLNYSIAFRESPQEKREVRENAALRAALEESMETYEEFQAERRFSSPNELKAKAHRIEHSSDWILQCMEDCIYFLFINYDPSPTILWSLEINSQLNVTVYCAQDKFISDQFPEKVQDISEISEVLSKLESFHPKRVKERNSFGIISLILQLLTSLIVINPDFNEALNFISEQLILISTKKKSYSPSMMIFSCLIHSISPHCYIFLRQLTYIILPHPSTIRRLVSFLRLGPQMEGFEDNFLMYIKIKFSGNLCDKYCVLMMDEIHIKAQLDFKAGSFVGLDENTNELASSVYVFMLSSLLSNFKEVLHMVAVKRICASSLHSTLTNIILGLEEISFQIVCVVSETIPLTGNACNYSLRKMN